MWALWIFALAGISTLFGVALRILPPRLRRGYLPTALLCLALFAARALSSHDTRMVLWFAGLVGIAFLAVLPMGQMPADMAPAWDPACRLHPQYAALARRGRIAAIAFLGVAGTLITLSLIFVRGL